MILETSRAKGAKIQEGLVYHAPQGSVFGFDLEVPFPGFLSHSGKKSG